MRPEDVERKIPYIDDDNPLGQSIVVRKLMEQQMYLTEAIALQANYLTHGQLDDIEWSQGFFTD